VLINNQGERPSLLKQTAKPPGNWVLIQLVGTKSNRSAIGARVRVAAGDMTQTDEVRSGSGFISQSDLRLHFGLGAAQRIDKVEVIWPSGQRGTVANVEANRILVIKEGAEVQ
jgi:hypothetical protein